MLPLKFRSGLMALAGSVLAIGLYAQTPAPKLEFPQPSQAATVKQRIGVTDIEVNYFRPSMRGRKIFGGLEPYGTVWRTGANNATKITFSTPVKFGGTEVPAGSYALFSIPDQNEWTVILNKVVGQWGSYTYDEKNDAARAKAKPVATPVPVESFAIGFSDVSSESATNLYLTWENVRVSVKLEIDTVGILKPQIEAAMASAEKKPYFGAAMFYYENNLDLKQALAWIDAGLAESPDAFWMIYRKGLILEKSGDKAGAKAAAEQSLALAEKDKRPSLRDEYVRLNKALLSRL